MPERDTPVELRNAERARQANWSDASRSRSGIQRQERRVVILGAPADLPRALTHPAVANGRFVVVQSIGVDIESEDCAGLTETAALLRAGRADTLFVAGEVGPSTMRRVADLALAFHCEVLAVMPTEVLPEHAPIIVWSGESPLVQLTKLPRHPVENAAKRFIDILGAATGLLIAAPVLAVLSAVIMIESPGSPLFRHQRVGYRGRKFDCLKLRTMHTDAEDILRANPAMYEDYRQNHYKLPEDRDPRVTKLGRFLRKTSLDELPQLWNVLVGEMSLVGPRPVVDEELAMYGGDQDLMLSVKPGLTGAWAVNGRQAVGYPERCELELRYVRERNLASDARIMAKTAAVVLGSFKRDN